MPDPAHLAWACGQCNRVRRVHWYTLWLMRLLRWQKAGVPLARWCELSLETWEDLGQVAQALETAREQVLMSNTLGMLWRKR